MLFTLVPQLSDLPVRVPLGLLMVLFVPGYTLIAALFPKKDDLDGIERVALSFGLSIAVVPLIGLGLNYTPWGIRLTPVVISLAIFTVAMALAAHLRRRSLPLEMRFSVEFRKGVDSVKEELMADSHSRLDKALTVLLVLSIIASVAALVYVIVTPKQGEKFTEFYILGPGGMAYNYPTAVQAGNQSTVIVGVVNHEYALVNYTMDMSVNNSTILQRKIALQHNQTWEKPVTYVLNRPGDSQKLQFLLYRENNFTAPYRDLHLWVNVSSKSDGEYQKTGSAIPPQAMEWFARYRGLDPNDPQQYEKARSELENMLKEDYWRIISRGEPLTEEAGNCEDDYCLVRWRGACVSCREREIEFLSQNSPSSNHTA